jgi:hypothetical protein
MLTRDWVLAFSAHTHSLCLCRCDSFQWYKSRLVSEYNLDPFRPAVGVPFKRQLNNTNCAQRLKWNRLWGGGGRGVYRERGMAARCISDFFFCRSYDANGGASSVGPSVFLNNRHIGHYSCKLCSLYDVSSRPHEPLKSSGLAMSCGWTTRTEVQWSWDRGNLCSKLRSACAQPEQDVSP